MENPTTKPSRLTRGNTNARSRTVERFIELGTSSPRKYNAEEKAILEGLSDGDADRFEDAQRRLGSYSASLPATPTIKARPTEVVAVGLKTLRRIRRSL